MGLWTASGLEPGGPAVCRTLPTWAVCPQQALHPVGPRQLCCDGVLMPPLLRAGTLTQVGTKAASSNAASTPSASTSQC